MASKGKKNSSRQKSAKDNGATSASGLWSTLITVLGTILVAYLGYRQVIEVPRMSIEATQTAQAQILAWTQTSSAILPPPMYTPTATPVHTFTPTPTTIFTPSVTPSRTATSSPTATPTPRPIRANCIDPQNWTPDSTTPEILAGVTLRANGCYAMEALGIFTDSTGTLYLNNSNKRDPIVSGIYTKIQDNSVIEFKVYVNSMYLVYPENPVFVSFAVAPESDPMSARNTARFKLQVEDSGERPFVHFVLAHINENNGAKVGSQHYEYGRTYTIRLELVGNTMKVYINGLEMDKKPLIPTSPKVFYIGYNIPIIAGVDVKVSNITVDGLPR